MAKKESFVLYNSYYELIEDLNMEQRGALLTAVLEHARGENQPALDPIVKIAYRVIAAQLDRDHKKWEETCARRAEAGRKGGIAKANNAKQDAANLASTSNAKQDAANLASTSNAKQNVANLAKASNAKQNVANLAKASNAKQSLANLAEYEYEYENEDEDVYDSVYDNGIESDNDDMPLTTQAYIDFRDSFRKKFIESFGREPDRPFLSGVRNKLEHISIEDVWRILKLAASKRPRNPEAYILAALKQKQERPVVYSEQDPSAPLADWEKEWLAEVRRRQALQAGVQQEEPEEEQLPEDDRQGKEAVI